MWEVSKHLKWPPRKRFMSWKWPPHESSCFCGFLPVSTAQNLFLDRTCPIALEKEASSLATILHSQLAAFAPQSVGGLQATLTTPIPFLPT
jgi:hypothetical protein